MVGQLLQEDQKRQIERMNQLGGSGTSNSGPPFLSWLTKLVPGKERKQPLNPYQEISRDREVMRLMKKKKSLGSVSSRPSFCTWVLWLITEKFKGIDAKFSGSVAADRSGNEREVNISKRSGFIKSGYKPQMDPQMFEDVWLTWLFQANFMYNPIL